MTEKIAKQENAPVPQRNIHEMDEVNLKALCFEQIVLLQQTQNNINIIQEELNKRAAK